MRLCLYLDAGINARRARLLIDGAWRDEAPLYGLQISVAETTRWLRPAFTMDGIMEALTREPLRPGCDRLFALVGRHVLYHLLGCDHHFRMDRCYQQIARLKASKRANESEFFPAWDFINRRVLASRDAVNERISALRVGSAATSR